MENISCIVLFWLVLYLIHSTGYNGAGGDNIEDPEDPNLDHEFLKFVSSLPAAPLLPKCQRIEIRILADVEEIVILAAIPANRG